MASSTVKSDRTGITYGDRGAGETIVLVHAFPLNREMWGDQETALAAYHRVLTPDVFGFGGSSSPEGGWSVDSYADRMAELLDGLNITGPIVLGGLSMGGYIALAFARKFPERLKGLILADTRADADSPEAKANREKTIVAMANQTSADLIEQMLPKMLAETTRQTKPEVVTKVRELASKQLRECVIAGLKALRDRPDSTASLKGFQFPVLVIVGAEEAITPLALAEAMVKELPNATLAVIPNAGHLSNLEQPEAYTAAISQWLAVIR
jgi:pimeloyl-ACP methyl ester carboxylesterase